MSALAGGCSRVCPNRTLSSCHVIRTVAESGHCPVFSAFRWFISDLLPSNATGHTYTSHGCRTRGRDHVHPKKYTVRHSAADTKKLLQCFAQLVQPYSTFESCGAVLESQCFAYDTMVQSNILCVANVLRLLVARGTHHPCKSLNACC